MRFLTLKEVPIKDLAVYRAFPLSSILMLMILTPVIPLLATRGSTNGILWYIVCILVLLWLLGANDLRKAFQSTAWLVAISDKNIYVKWRSYQNVHWGTHDIQILELPLACIDLAREIKRSWQSQDNSEMSRFLELTLRHDTSTQDLAKYLADERSARPGGVPVRKSKWGHFPVSIEPGNRLRVQWRALPSMANCIRCLNSHGVPTPASQSIDILPSVEELARSGNLFTLIENLRTQDPSLTLSQAKSKADALIAQSIFPNPKGPPGT